MSSRFNLAPVFRGHWKGLSVEKNGKLRGDWAARLTLLILPLIVVGFAIWRDWQVRSPSPLLAGVSLLAGALVSAFTHLSTLRMKLVEWSEQDEDKWAVERDMLDETAAHLLMAALACAVEAVLIVVGLNSRSEQAEVISGPLAAIALGVASYIFVMFLICLPRLYGAYVEINGVGELSGFIKNKRSR